MGGRSYPAEIAHLPEVYRKAIYDQCKGNWARVTVDRGTVTVHNRPHPEGLRAPRTVKAPVKRLTKPAPPPPPRGPLPAPPPVRRQPALPADRPVDAPQVIPRPTLTPLEQGRWQLTPHATTRLAERGITAAEALACAQSPELVTPGATPESRVYERGGIRVVVNPSERTILTVMHRAPEMNTPQPRRQLRPASEVLGAAPVFQEPEPGEQWSLMPGDELSGGYDGADLAEAKAWRLVSQVRDGLGDRCALLFHGDVTALNGVDLDQVESVVRHAQRVEVDPSSAAKGFPVLRFHRGDNMVVVGFLNPAQPLVVAAYFNTFRNVGSGGSHAKTGGGGARKSGGVPTTINQLMNALRGIGVTIAEPGRGDEVVAISFEGASLGKVPCVDSVSKAAIEQAWQRAQRRVNAIKEREAAGKTG